MRLELAFRLLGGLAFAAGGVYLGGLESLGADGASEVYRRVGAGLFGLFLGLLVAPYLTVRPVSWIANRARRIPAQELVAATLGLLIALILSALVAIPLSMLPSILGQVMPFVACVALSYLGMTIASIRRDELFGLFRGARGGEVDEDAPDEALLDTSAIIDGRIADICQTGFLPEGLVVPRFVLAEVQHIADSPEALRRNRGRRGLEMLARLGKATNVKLRVLEGNGGGTEDVDARLVSTARAMKCPIITNDFNLNRVAAIQGVRVLNVNELANAVKTVILPGEEMTIRIIQDGREVGQGVGYLDDGTMVVVEGGRRFTGEELEVIVTRVLQTAAGKMIFAHPKVVGSAS